MCAAPKGAEVLGMAWPVRAESRSLPVGGVVSKCLRDAALRRVSLDPRGGAKLALRLGRVPEFWHSA